MFTIVNTMYTDKYYGKVHTVISLSLTWKYFLQDLASKEFIHFR